ncbi:MAG: hypothetical protein IKB88_02595 [Clostridia bacterium]|nr:hypothetical protein [Clostridia bacterium]
MVTGQSFGLSICNGVIALPSPDAARNILSFRAFLTTSDTVLFADNLVDNENTDFGAPSCSAYFRIQYYSINVQS